MGARNAAGTNAWLQSMAARLGLAVAVLGGIVLLGWVLDASLLKGVLPGHAAMKVNSALCFICLGSALFLRAVPAFDPRRLRSARILTVIATTLAGLTLFQYLTGINLGIDQAIFRDTDLISSPGRMSPFTSVSFLLVGAALLSLDAPRYAWLVQTAVLMTIGNNILVAAGYLYDASALYQAGSFTAVAAHTATSFLVLGIGLVAARPDRGMAAIVVSDATGGMIARRLLPVAIGLPLLIGWLRLQGQRAGWYGTEFGLAIFAVANIFCFSTVVLLLASSLNDTEGERKRAERWFRLAVEASPNGMVMIDAHGQIVLVNSQTERLFGYRRDELLGQSVEKLVPDRFRSRHPDDRMNYFADPHARSMGVGRELFGRRKDGSEFPVEIGLNPMHTEEGLLVLSAIVDITERKREEESVRQSEKRLNAVMENMTEGIVISDLNGNLIHWNRAALELHGASSLDEWKRQLLDFTEIFELSTTTGRVLPLDEWPMSRLLRGERLRDYELRVKRLDVPHEWVFSYGGGLVHDAAGKQVAFLTITDVTERKRAETALRQAHHELEQRVSERTAELEAANKELEAFSYSVSHDLRAPLRAIDGFSRILLSEYAASLPPDAQDYLRDVRGSAQRMGQLVDDLLALSRLNRQPIRKQAVDCAGLVRTCLDELRGELDGRTIDFRVGDLPPCQADPALLKQVWINLLSNAIKYTARRDPATIEIGGRPGDPPPQRTYFVKDNGAGFDMRYAHKLFGVFQRLHRAEEYPGTGVGLAIVQRIIHRHGGTVWAEAQPDRGATFYFSLQASEVPYER